MKYFLSICCFFFSLSFATELSAQATSTAATSVTTQSITVKVTGVGCNTDIKTIGEEVEKLDGVRSCEAAKRGAVTRFVVLFDPEVACEDDIYQAIEDTPGCKNPNDRPYRVKL